MTQEPMDKIDSERSVGDNEIAKYINEMPTTPEEYYASALEVGKRSDLTVEQKVQLLQAIIMLWAMATERMCVARQMRGLLKVLIKTAGQFTIGRSTGDLY